MVMSKTFTWDAKTPADIAAALKELAKFQPALNGGRDAVKLVFKKSKDTTKCAVKKDKDGSMVITYGKMNMALRMVGNLMGSVIPEEVEYCPFNMFGIMLDCSRNAVMTTDYMKQYFARLALFGYNMIMLYTEDTYQIEGEPFFGFMRGALSRKEILEMDEFCGKLGMEMIPCIQTLGHLAEAIQWPAIAKYSDTPDILMAGEETTYQLIEKMLLSWKGLRSKRIHLGMDETHNIGRGKFYDKNGDVPHVEIFTKHLSKVVKLCKKHGFEPMIWSDMYFRLASHGGGYYDKAAVVTKDVIKKIPKGVELVYWDYYHEDKDFYLDWIGRHRQMAGEPLMGSGVWTWGLFWYGKGITERTVIPCLAACRESKVKDVFFTMWGDDGGYCDYDSAMTGLGFASELAFTGAVSNDNLNKKFDAILDGANYDNSLTAATLSDAMPSQVVWDDPLMLMQMGGMKYRNELKPMIEKLYAASKKLTRVPKRGFAGDLKLAKQLMDAMIAKAIMADALIDAYSLPKAKMAAELKLVLPMIDDYEKKFTAFTELFCAMWKRHNKPFGLETMQVRFAGQLARVAELKIRLKDLISGKAKTVPEFEELKKVKKDLWVWGYLHTSHASTIR